MADAADEPHVLLLSGPLEARGSCGYTLRLAEHLPPLGVQTTVVCAEAELVEPVRRQALHIREYPHLTTPVIGRIVERWLEKDLGDAPPDLIHCQSRRMTGLANRLARHWQRPYILTVHDHQGRSDYARIDWQWCRRVIAVSESVRRDFTSRVAPPAGRINVIPSGVDVDANVPSVVPLEADHVPVVGTAGPLEAVKGLPFFLGAARKVLATGRDVEFLVAGAGPEEVNLRRLARELGIAQHVTFVPYVLDFTESLAAMDIFCLPSLQQGLGTIMLEAMALGKPVIASRIGGVYSVVHDNETGLLVPPSDYSQLADAVLELLCDPLRARAIGEAARTMVRKEFPIERTTAQTADIYRSLMSEFPRTGEQAARAAKRASRDRQRGTLTSH